MTNRTASLLMLFVAALMTTAVLLALIIGAIDSVEAAGPWLAPLVAVVCQTGMLYLGRRFILSPAFTTSASRAAFTILPLVIVTLLGAYAVGWSLRWAVERAVAAPALTLILWFALLSAAVNRQHNWH
jgi:hypothetical protein